MLKTKINDQIRTSCFSGVDKLIKCSECAVSLVRNGLTKAGKQRFLCKSCGSSKVQNPGQNGYKEQYDFQIVRLKIEGLGIRSTARFLGISAATVVRRILIIAENIEIPKIPDKLGRIQVDELHTIIQSKKREIYVIYSWDQDSKRALSLTVGTRSKANLRKVINPLLESEVESINTDMYSGYRGVVPKKKHTTFKRRNNGIERQNLNLRTRLKRLNRRTICFSKSVFMLEAVLKIYFWYSTDKITESHCFN